MRIRFFFLAVAIFSKLCALGNADDGVWQSLNPAYFMNQVKSADIGYTDLNQKYIFAAEAEIDGKVWYSIDDGIWSDAELNIADHGIRRIAVQKNNFRYAWALVPGNTYDDDQAGPFLYDRNTGLWVQKTNGLESGKLLSSMAVDYTSEGLGKVLVGGRGLLGQGAILFRTVDSGDNWVDVTSGIPGIHSPYNKIVDIAIDQANPQIAYFILFTINEYSMYRGLYKSEDRGINWT